MAWNGSGSAGGSAAPQAPKKKSGASSPLWQKGALAGLVVVAISAAVLYMMRPAEKTAGKLAERDTPRKISEATPVVVTNKTVEPVAKKEIPYWEVDASQTNGFSYTMMKKWNDMHEPPPGHVFKSLRKKSRWHIFNHKSENMIASLLRFTPGKASFGRPHFSGLTEDFLKSCQEPIIVDANDDEYTAALKREMNQVKIELKPRIDAGESLEKILEDTRDEYRKLAQFKRDLAKEVRQLVEKDAKTVEDVEALEQAANKVLEGKGIAPLKFSAITKSRLKTIKGEEDL